MIGEGTNILTLTTALIVLTLLLGGTITVADVAFSTADRDASEQQLAEAYSDQIVASPEGSTPYLNTSQIDVYSEQAVEPLRSEVSGVEVQVDGKKQYAFGTVTEGTTVDRIVVDQEKKTKTGSELSIPQGVQTCIINVNGAEKVLVDNRTALQNKTGLTGNYTVPLSAASASTVTATEGNLTVSYQTTKTERILSVTVEVDK